MLAHVKRAVAWSNGCFHLEIVLRACCLPFIAVDVTFVDEHCSEYTISVIVDHVRRLSPVTVFQIRRVRVHSDVSADGTLPIREK